MKIRNLIVTIIFFLIIAVISIGSLIMNFTGLATNTASDKQQEVLEVNGTLEKKDVSNDLSEGKRNLYFEKIADKPSNHLTVNYEEMPLLDKWEVVFTDFKRYTDVYVEDMFLSDLFIKANANLSYILSGHTYIEGNKVLVGKEDYLFYKDVTDGDPIADYQGDSLFTDEEILKATNDLQLLQEKLNNKGIDMYLLVFPNKELVYSQYMPDTIYRKSLYTPGQQIKDFLTQYTDIKVIYPYNKLIEVSQNYPVFYKTDTHANRIGSFVAFQEYMKERYGKCQEVEDMKLIIKMEGFSGDLSVLTKVADTEAKDTVYLIEEADQDMYKEETIVLVGDSFTGYLSNIAEMYYSNVYRIDSEDFTMEALEKINPDVVIYELGERRIEYLLTEELYNK